MGAPFYNRVAVPVALLLLILTAVGPLLAWRKTSFDSLKRNFLWPTVGAVVAMAFLMITPPAWGSPFGMRPWQDIAYFYSLMAIGLCVLVTLTIASEYYRGGKVIAGHTGQGMFASMVQLTHRNTRRYGGYIVHFGVVVVIIGLAGSAFNLDKEAGNGLGYGDKMTIGNYELVCRSFTQDDDPNYASEWAIMDVYQNGKKVDTLTPQRLFYKASQQASTKPSIRSDLQRGSVSGLRRPERKGTADHQSAPEPAGDVDLDRCLDYSGRNSPGPGAQRPSSSTRPISQTGASRHPSGHRRLGFECGDSRLRLSAGQSPATQARKKCIAVKTALWSAEIRAALRAQVTQDKGRT